MLFLGPRKSIMLFELFFPYYCLFPTQWNLCSKYLPQLHQYFCSHKLCLIQCIKPSCRLGNCGVSLQASAPFMASEGSREKTPEQVFFRLLLSCDLLLLPQMACDYCTAVPSSRHVGGTLFMRNKILRSPANDKYRYILPLDQLTK